MSRWRSIALVARREILERGRSRGFLLSVLFTTVLVVGSIIVPAIFLDDDKPTPVGLVEPAPAGLAPAIEASGQRFEHRLAVTTYPEAASATSALERGDVQAVVTVPPDLSSAGTIQVKERPEQALAQVVSSAVIALRVQSVMDASGVDTAALAAAQTPPTLDSLHPQTDADEGRFIVANIGAVLILVGIFSFGFTVLTGVVEEKQSRVVEVVLATVRPRDLLMGKVLGIGILGLVQLFVFVVSAFVAAVLFTDLTLPTTTPSAIALLALWFILGYTLYSTALGFMGALASRMEEASNAATPVTMIAMLSYFVAILGVINDPSGLVATIATFVPPMAPFVVPLRVAFDAISPLEVAISVALTVVAIWLLFTIGARVYAGAVLQTAGRIKLRDAWRSAGE
jgi:ABC-2 type transport system permease protein